MYFALEYQYILWPSYPETFFNVPGKERERSGREMKFYIYVYKKIYLFIYFCPSSE